MALNNVPLAGQTLLFTRDLIQENFADINTGFAQDHVAFGIANAGKHQAIHLVNQTNAPAAPITGANEMGLYSAVSLFDGAPALYVKRQNSAANVNGIDFTSYGNGQNGWCQLPSGIILRWGTVTSNGAIAFNVAQTHVYPAGVGQIAFSVGVFSVQITTKATGTASGDNYNTFAQPLDWTTSFLQFTYLASQRTNNATRQTTFTYLAIGI